jgi:hypothetical protein
LCSLAMTNQLEFLWQMMKCPESESYAVAGMALVSVPACRVHHIAYVGVSWMYIRPPGMAEAGEDPGGTPASDKPSASVPHATPDGGTAPQEGHPMPARAFRPKTEEERGQGQFLLCTIVQKESQSRSCDDSFLCYRYTGL